MMSTSISETIAAHRGISLIYFFKIYNNLIFYILLTKNNAKWLLSFTNDCFPSSNPLLCILCLCPSTIESIQFYFPQRHSEIPVCAINLIETNYWSPYRMRQRDVVLFRRERGAGNADAFAGGSSCLMVYGLFRNCNLW